MITAEEWEPAAGLALEPNAAVAVRETSQSTAVTAGPGAGKTELLGQRADFLFRTGACPYPQRILAISFKVDAAANLRSRVKERCGYALAARFDSHTFHAFAKRLIDRYRPVLSGVDALNPDYIIGPQRAQGAMITFSDLVPLALKIAQSSDIVHNAVRQTYSHVFLDEFQDCTAEQYELVHTLFRGSSALLTAVGDTKQRIMAWAGALDGVFARMQADFDARPLTLYLNFRSKPVLRRMQNRMVAVMEPPAAMPESEISGDEGQIDVEHLADDEREAEHVANLIRELLDSDTSPSDIAVLIAKRPDLIGATLFARLAEEGIPFRDEQAVQDLTAEPIAEVVLDGLRVIVADRQPDAYHRLMTMADRLAVDEEHADQLRAQLDRYMAGARNELTRAELDFGDPEQLYNLIHGYLNLFGTDVLASLAPDYHDSRRVDELIEALLGRLNESIASSHDPARAVAMLGEQQAVRILSIHKSKGLEFEVVVVLGVEEETFWANRDEERRVFFVGISRAKSRLVLTTAASRPRPPGAPWNWKIARHPHQEFLGYV